MHFHYIGNNWWLRCASAVGRFGLVEDALVVELCRGLRISFKWYFVVCWHADLGRAGSLAVRSDLRIWRGQSLVYGSAGDICGGRRVWETPIFRCRRGGVSVHKSLYHTDFNSSRDVSWVV